MSTRNWLLGPSSQNFTQTIIFRFLELLMDIYRSGLPGYCVRSQAATVRRQKRTQEPIRNDGSRPFFAYLKTVIREILRNPASCSAVRARADLSISQAEASILCPSASKCCAPVCLARHNLADREIRTFYVYQNRPDQLLPQPSSRPASFRSLELSRDITSECERIGHAAEAVPVCSLRR
jgi:hypothetical protein